MNKNVISLLKLASGPLAAVLLLLLVDLVPGKPEVTRMAAVTIWVALWWLTEAVHIAVTAFVPLIFMPLWGIADVKLVAAQYMDQVIFLFIGGFLLAFGIERWDLHRRLSLKILLTLGSSPARLLLGIMSCAFFLSMWVSNTATVMMLLSAVMSLVGQTERHAPNTAKPLATALLLGLAYSASIGGMATLVGTPTNMIFAGYYRQNYPAGVELSFFKWFMLGFPLALLLLVFCYFLLYRVYLRGLPNMAIDDSLLEKQYCDLGPMRYEEKMVSAVFGLTAFLWFSRSDIDFGAFVLPGWSTWLSKPDFIQDSVVAIAGAFVLFFIPSKARPQRHILEWEDAHRLPFAVILLFGSGFALAKGFELSGLNTWLAAQLDFLHQLPMFLLLFGLCLLVAVLSEFASNVASIQLMLPILASLAATLQVNPLLLMIPATFAASLGFMLPVATAPNTIVFGTQRIAVRNMMQAGFWLDLFGAFFIALFVYFLGAGILGL